MDLQKIRNLSESFGISTFPQPCGKLYTACGKPCGKLSTACGKLHLTCGKLFFHNLLTLWKTIFPQPCGKLKNSKSQKVKILTFLSF